jgi:hypothetical protein
VYFEKSRSKTGEVWRAVTTPDTTEALQNYLKVRGVASPNEPLFKSREGFLDNQAVSRVVSDLIGKAGFGDVVGFKPTSLRDAFEDALVDANVNHKVKEALMGHTGEIEHEYGSYKKLKENCVAAMKKTYPFLALSNEMINEAHFPLVSEVKLLKEENGELQRKLCVVEDGLRKFEVMNYANMIITAISTPKKDRKHVLEELQYRVPELFNDEVLYQQVTAYIKAKFGIQL